LVNNYEITFSATEHLVRKGYKRIVHLTGTNGINVFRDRQRGYSDALQKNNIEYLQPIVLEDNFSVEIGKNIFSKLWNSPERPDAIISSSVHLTMGILLQARVYGIDIPTQLGLITFGTLLSSEIIQPQITYIDQPEKEIAEISFELLEKMINHELSADETFDRVVNAEIIYRETC